MSHAEMFSVLFSGRGLLGSIVNLDGPGHYLHWHFIQISVANLIVIISMVVLFVGAIIVPFPRHRSKGGSDNG